MSERDYLKGVPLRLAKSFYPLARPQFKEIDIHIPLDALQDEYDFGLERVAIETFETYQTERERLRVIEEKWRKEKAEADALEQERLRLIEEKWRKEKAEAYALEQERLEKFRHSTVGYYPVDNNSQTPVFPSWQQQWDAHGVLPPPYPGPLQLPVVTTGGSPSVESRTSASTMPLLTNGVPPVATSASTLNPFAPTPVSDVNSFTKIHFPFLTNYTQTNRERDRAAERIYHQQFNSIHRPLQRLSVAAASSPSNIGLPPPSDQVPATATGLRPSITPNQSYGGVSFPNRNVI
jgi:hypothetical protein